MESLFETRKNADLFLEASNGRYQKVHLCIMSIAVPIIDEILCDKVIISGIKIDVSGLVPIVIFPDFSYETLQCLVEFTYLKTCNPENSAQFLSLFDLASKLKYEYFVDFLSELVTKTGFKDKTALKNFTSDLMKVEEFPEKKLDSLVKALFSGEKLKEITDCLVDLKDITDPDSKIRVKYNFNCGQHYHNLMTDVRSMSLVYIGMLETLYPNLIKKSSMTFFIVEDSINKVSCSNGNPPFYKSCGCYSGNVSNQKIYTLDQIISILPEFKNIDYNQHLSSLGALYECPVYKLSHNNDIYDKWTSRINELKFKEKYYKKE